MCEGLHDNDEYGLEQLPGAFLKCSCFRNSGNFPGQHPLGGICGEGVKLKHAVLLKMDPTVTIPNLAILGNFAEVSRQVFFPKIFCGCSL